MKRAFLLCYHSGNGAFGQAREIGYGRVCRGIAQPQQSDFQSQFFSSKRDRSQFEILPATQRNFWHERARFQRAE